MCITSSFNTSLSSLKFLPYINEARTQNERINSTTKRLSWKACPLSRTNRMHFPSTIPIMSRESSAPALLRVHYGNLGLSVPFRAAWKCRIIRPKPVKTHEEFENEDNDASWCADTLYVNFLFLPFDYALLSCSSTRYYLCPISHFIWVNEPSKSLKFVRRFSIAANVNVLTG